MMIALRPATSSPEAVVLHTLFSALEEHGVSYAVMRNYEPLPDSTEGSDLDILVPPRDGSRAKEIVLEAIRRAGGVSIGIADSVGFYKVVGLGRTQDGSERWWGLCVDVNVGLYFHGHRLLNHDVGLPVRLHRGIRVLSDSFGAILAVLKDVLYNGKYPDQYSVRAHAAVEEDWPNSAALLAPMGQPTLAALRALMLSKAPSHDMARESRKVRGLFLREIFLGRPIRSILDQARYEWSKIYRYVKPPGVVVAIFGVDGAGKSTVIDTILPVLNAATHNAVVVRHLRPGWLPPLARLRGDTGSSGPVLDPHASQPSGVFGSVLRLVYLTSDYVFGYWLCTRPRIAKLPTVILFDRYAQDMGIDPLRFRIGLPARVAGWFAALAPKPDLIICLHGSPELIHARKREVPLEETRRQVEALREFAYHEPRAVLISTDTSVEETRNRVLETLCNLLRSRSVR